jgi:hypothetical protein
MLLMLWMAVGRIHMRWHAAIGRSTVWWVVAHWRIGHHLTRGCWWRHGVAMTSACLTWILMARLLMARILVIGKVAPARIAGGRRALGKGILAIGSKGVLSVGGVCFVAERHQLTCRRLCTAWEAVLVTWIRHQAGRVAIWSMLGYVAPAGTGMAGGVARASRGSVWVVVVILDFESVLVVDGLGPWPPRPACALQFAAATATTVTLVARGGIWHRRCVARRRSIAVRRFWA